MATNDVILTTDTDLHSLEKIEDAARPGTKMLYVPRDAVMHLLRDHITLLEALREKKLLQVTAGPELRSLV
jgi:hypothetical protein